MAQGVNANLAACNEDEGRCVEEDLVKSFFPSLFDSDSDSEDVYCLHSIHSHDNEGSSSVLAQSSLRSSAKVTTDMTSPLTKAHSTSLLNLSRKLEALPEPGSPLSQENSAHTIFQPGPLEHSGSIGDQSPFHSVLSQASSSSVFDVDSLEASPLKKRKAEWAPARNEAPVADALGPTAASEAARGLHTAVSAQSGFPKHSTISLGRQGSFGRPLCLAGGITTGVPVDSCPMPNPKPLSLGRSSSANVSPTYTNVWASHGPTLPPMHQTPQGQMLNTWCSPPAMIPTTSCVAPPPAPFSNPLQNPKAPIEGSEKIAAALAEIAKAPVGISPLGLKLDKVAVMHQLSAMGMRSLGN